MNPVGRIHHRYEGAALYFILLGAPVWQTGIRSRRPLPPKAASHSGGEADAAALV
jgi:hypothetical protein